jgi:hypothetical protein
MKNKSFLLLLLAAISTFIAFACKKEKHQIIPNDFKIYVQRFFSEANKRGLSVKLEDSDLEIRFSKLVGANGKCNTRSKIIEIDSVSWQQSNEFDKEWLIYHELGHCILGRNHLSKTLPHGECQSIMRNSEELNCSINFSSESWRSYYFDELFTQTNFIPNWYTDTLIVLSDSILILKDKKTNFREDSFILAIPQLDTSKNFIIDFAFIQTMKTSRDICLQFDNKIISFKTIVANNIATVQNTNRYLFAGRSNVNVNLKIYLKIIKNKRYYHFLVNETIIHTMDFDTVKDMTIKILCLSTEYNFDYSIYNFK